MLSVVVFDEGAQTGAILSPLTDLRAVFDVRTGALTTLERIMLNAQLNDLPQVRGLLVPQTHALIAAEKHRGHRINDLTHLDESIVLVNGAAPFVDTDTAGLELNHAVLDPHSGRLVKAHVPKSRVHAVLCRDFAGLSIDRRPTPLLNRCWDLRTHRDAAILLDLKLLLTKDADFVTIQGARASASATIHPSVIIDTTSGPVLIDDHATIRPGAIIVGPAYIGPHSTVLERSLIKSNTVIGPHCKVAGEIGGTIFQGFANKAHDGHLGDSYVGEWSNLGAGTTNSNLLNTYGEVICRPLLADGTSGSNERTGHQFLGAIIGDHVKTAICTRIMTGAIVGTGTMFAASAPLSGTVAPMSWITDAGTKRFALGKFQDVAKAVMARRKLAPSEAYLAQLNTLISA